MIKNPFHDKQTNNFLIQALIVLHQVAIKPDMQLKQIPEGFVAMIFYKVNPRGICCNDILEL
jgi:hypothetical protein